MSVRPRQRLAVPILAVGAVLALSTLLGAGQALLPIVPLMVLVFSMLLGHYPGAEIIARVGKRSAGGPHSRGLRAARPALFRSSFARGGLLIAMALSGRAPPV